MKITDVTTTFIFNPDAAVIQDATMPPPKPGTQGRSTIFIHIHTDEGTQGFSYLNSPAAIRALINDNLSSAFVPIESMPGWLQPFTSINPVTNAVDLGRSLSQGGPIVSNAITTALWTLGMTVVNGPIAVWQYRRV